MSKHPSQVNFVNCDGSIRPVNQTINKLVLNKLMSRAGGETISADETRLTPDPGAVRTPGPHVFAAIEGLDVEGPGTKFNLESCLA